MDLQLLPPSLAGCLVERPNDDDDQIMLIIQWIMYIRPPASDVNKLILMMQCWLSAIPHTFHGILYLPARLH